jgi:hypothetical protein
MYQREVPYHCDVRVVSFEERKGPTEIHADILVSICISMYCFMFRHVCVSGAGDSGEPESHPAGAQGGRPARGLRPGPAQPREGERMTMMTNALDW